MKIGFIGFSKNINKLTDRLFTEDRLSVSGIFSTKKDLPINENIRFFSTAEDVIKHSDMVYLAEEESVFQLSKLAIKESVHLYYESPFILCKEEFDNLFDLSNETNCLIKLNQYILHKQVYLQLKDRLAPHIMKCYTGFNSLRNQKKNIQQRIYDFVILTRDNIKSGIRKISCQKTSGNNSLPVNFCLYLYFDNGTSAELLFSQITEKEYFILESYQKEEKITIDLKNNTAQLTELKGKNVNTIIKQKVNNQDKTSRDIKLFINYLEEHPSKPLTVREENQHLLNITYELTRQVFET